MLEKEKKDISSGEEESGRKPLKKKFDKDGRPVPEKRVKKGSIF